MRTRPTVPQRTTRLVTGDRGATRGVYIPGGLLLLVLVLILLAILL